MPVYCGLVFNVGTNRERRESADPFRGGVALLEAQYHTVGVPLLVSFGTSSADGELACHSHCFSEDSEAVARLGWFEFIPHAGWSET